MKYINHTKFPLTSYKENLYKLDNYKKKDKRNFGKNENKRNYYLNEYFIFIHLNKVIYLI